MYDKFRYENIIMIYTLGRFQVHPTFKTSKITLHKIHTAFKPNEITTHANIQYRGIP